MKSARYTRIFACLWMKYKKNSVAWISNPRQVIFGKWNHVWHYQSMQEFVEFHQLLTASIELRGYVHRFKDDPVFGECARIRNGTVHRRYRVYQWAGFVTATTVLPPNIQYATYYNKDRDAINTGFIWWLLQKNRWKECSLSPQWLGGSRQLQSMASPLASRSSALAKLWWRRC
jgi:hypothetical protein